jgi:hypothetical protein
LASVIFYACGEARKIKSQHAGGMLVSAGWTAVTPLFALCANANEPRRPLQKITDAFWHLLFFYA